MKMKWDGQKSAWKGACPRCGNVGFFNADSVSHYPPNYSIDILHCPNDHIFVVEYYHGSRETLLEMYPVEYKSSVPSWLPEVFHNTYEEALDALSRRKYRSAVALCGILLEADVNTKLTVDGDKKKNLFQRLTILKTQNKIDQDQFSDATITRLTRNELLHPQEILSDISEEDATNVFESVTAYLERTYKYRSSRALPAPEEGVKE